LIGRISFINSGLQKITVPFWDDFDFGMTPTLELSHLACPSVTANLQAQSYAAIDPADRGQTEVSRNQFHNFKNERRLSHVRTHP
jgi:hypothetical protein